MIARWRWFLGTIVSLLLLMSCNEEEHPLPAYRQDLAEIRSDYQGLVRQISFDDGRKYSLSNILSGFPSDTTIRILALYEEQGREVMLHDALAVFSPFPRFMPADSVCLDPLKVKAAWRSNFRYVNLLLTRSTGGGVQYFAFVNHPIQQLENGLRKWSITLYHRQGSDPTFYSADSYVSCPTYHYADSLRVGIDSVEISVPMHNGMYRKSFLY